MRRTESLEVSLSWKLIKQGTNDATVAWTGCIATIQITFFLDLRDKEMKGVKLSQGFVDHLEITCNYVPCIHLKNV